MALEGKQFSHYRLLQLIGRGGMGEVYLAEDIQVRRQVAVKVLRIEASVRSQEDGGNALRLFWREATAIARLDHPNILPLYDHGEAAIDGIPQAYLIMPYRPEGSLISWLRRRAQTRQTRQLTLKQVAHLILQAGRALQYAHEQRVMHLDVKPDNFLIRSQPETDEYPDLLLTDFGIARLASATTGQSQHIRGTPSYMAPEQCVGQPAFASDQYALAIMAYELLTGNPPFRGTPMQVMFAHMQEQPGAARARNPLLPPDVDFVLQQALAKRPEQRFSSVASFAQAFQGAFRRMDETTVVRALPSSPDEPSMTPQPGMSPMTPPPTAGWSITPPQQPGMSPRMYPPASGVSSMTYPPAPGRPSTGPVYATLTISRQEARNGGTRCLTLADGRRLNVRVPPGTQSGQVLSLNGWGTTTSPGTTAGKLSLRFIVDERSTGGQMNEPAMVPARPTRRISPVVFVARILLPLLLVGGLYLGIYRASSGQWPWGTSLFNRVPGISIFSSHASSASRGQWHTQTSGTAQDLKSVAWSGSEYVAVGGTFDPGNGVNVKDNALVLTSPDGHTWTNQHADNLPDLSEVVWTGKQFVALGSTSKNEKVIVTSPNGHSWTIQTPVFDDQDSADFSEFTSIAWADSQLVAVGFFGYVFTSLDGHRWTTRYRGDRVSGLEAAIWSGSQLAAVGDAGAILTSSDWITWTPQASKSSAGLKSVAWGDSQFVAVGDAILNSPDGENWTVRRGGGTDDLGNLTDVIWAGTQFVSVGWFGDVFLSSDGKSWFSQSVGSSTVLNGVTWSGSQLVAVGDKGTILTSP